MWPEFGLGLIIVKFCTEKSRYVRVLKHGCLSSKSEKQFHFLHVISKNYPDPYVNPVLAPINLFQKFRSISYLKVNNIYVYYIEVHILKKKIIVLIFNQYLKIEWNLILISQM